MVEEPVSETAGPPPRPDNYVEEILIGVIDGLTSSFNDDCRGGLAESIRTFFTLWDNLGIYDPRKISKFAMSTAGFTEATNIVYAYCDINQLSKQFIKLADYQNWEQYIVLASRVGGVFIKDYWTLSDCISGGKLRGNGYDVGLCSGKLTSLFLDTTF